MMIIMTMIMMINEDGQASAAHDTQTPSLLPVLPNQALRCQRCITEKGLGRRVKHEEMLVFIFYH